MVCSIIRVPFAAVLLRRVIFFYLRYILTAGGAQRHDRKAAVIGQDEAIAAVSAGTVPDSR